MKTGIKRASAFWHRFVAILKNKTVVPEALNIERGMNRMKFDSFQNNIISEKTTSLASFACFWNYKDGMNTKD